MVNSPEPRRPYNEIASIGEASDRGTSATARTFDPVVMYVSSAAQSSLRLQTKKLTVGKGWPGGGKVRVSGILEIKKKEKKGEDSNYS